MLVCLRRQECTDYHYCDHFLSDRMASIRLFDFSTITYRESHHLVQGPFEDHHHSRRTIYLIHFQGILMLFVINWLNPQP